MSIRKCHFNNDPFYEPAEQNQQRIIDDFDVNGDEKSTELFDDIFARKLQKCLYVNFMFSEGFLSLTSSLRVLQRDRERRSESHDGEKSSESSGDGF